MSRARETIFAALAAARPGEAPAPTRVPAPAMPDDALERLCMRVEESGGRFQSLVRSEWPLEIEWPIPLSTAQHVFSTMPGIDCRGVGANVDSDRELAALELCVLRGEFAVVENGAVWHIPGAPRERAAALLAEHLVLVVDHSELVATLHQAYDRIDLTAAPFGWFLSGPSKTADIEQSLVFGAHGPRTMQLVLMTDAD